MMPPSGNFPMASHNRTFCFGRLDQSDGELNIKISRSVRQTIMSNDVRNILPQVHFVAELFFIEFVKEFVDGERQNFDQNFNWGKSNSMD
jgi:hypothetical protein